MSTETLAWLNQNVLVGFTEKRGMAWHYKASEQEGLEPNHYPLAIPVEDVERRLFPWEAQSVPIFTRVRCDLDDPAHVDIDEEGYPVKYVLMDDHQAITRSDNGHVFRVFKDHYAIHQYREWLLRTVANLIDDDDLAIASAGLLKAGGVAWVSIELPDNIETPSGFSFRPQLLACTSHNGSLASTFKQVATAVVCDNTLERATSEKGAQFKARHSKNSGFRLQHARDALKIVHLTGDLMADQLESLACQPITGKQWDQILTDLIPVPKPEDTTAGAVTRAQNKVDTIRSLYASDERVAPWKGTALGVVQAFNTYAHHYAGLERHNRVERNLLGAITGRINEMDRSVMGYLTEKQLVTI